MKFIINIACALLVLGFTSAFIIQALLAKPKQAPKQAIEQVAHIKPTPENKTPEPPANKLYSSREIKLIADERGHYVADFKMNGRTITALVDTGASSVAINRTTARQLGIYVTQNDFIHEATTANGVTKMAVSTLKKVQIGRISVENVDVAILEDKALSQTLLGMSFLSKLKSFSVKNGELVLVQ